MRPSRPLTLLVAAASSLWLALPAAASPSTASGKAVAGGLNARSIAQIDALAQAKAGLSPTDRKIDSKLLATDKMRRNVPLAAGVGKVATGVTLDKAGRTTVSIKATTVDKATLAQIVKLGGRVRGADQTYKTVLADLPLSSVQSVAALPAVLKISVSSGYMTSKINAGPTPLPLSAKDKAASVRARVTAALAAAGGVKVHAASGGVTAAAGSVTSEGDAAHGADKARTKFKVSGVGVTVGVLSDGVDSLAASIASGDLPPDARALPGQAGDGDEGTAMMEIVHDLAPKAKILFATVNPTQEQFAANIRALRAAGASVIVDDVIYFAESPFQDGTVAQAVRDVIASGGQYFSSAGNEQNVDDGTAGNWEGDFVSSGTTIGKFAGVAHDFDPGAGVQNVDPLSEDTAGAPVILQWADPLGHAGDDYDLYELDPAGNVIAFSNDVQDGNDDAFEGFFTPFVSGGGRIAVVKFAGANRYFQVTPFRGRFADDLGQLTAFNTPGVTRGHSAVNGAYSVAAVPAADAFPREIAPGVPNPSGPFPGQFTAAQKSETFTSDGPRRVFFNPDGSEITPGNLTSTGGELRAKPDITAADGVSTSVPGFSPFFGTSAAAPHAAAIAALILSGNPGITSAEVRSALTTSAIDIEAPGPDRDTGVGIVMPAKALQITGATAQPFATPGKPTATPATGDGDAFLEPGETANLTVPVTNEGDAAAAQVSLQVSTTTPGVTVTPARKSYGRIPAGATTTATPFTLSLAPTFVADTPIALHFKVSFVGAYSPQTGDGSVVTGRTVSFAGPAVAIPDDDPAGADVHLTVSGVGAAGKVTFSIDGTDCGGSVGLSHTFVGDLVGTLISPTGTRVTLFSRGGGSGRNICQALFTDDATASFNNATFSQAPFTGSWKPATPLSALSGQNANGTWTFHVEDQALLDSGTINAVSLHFPEGAAA
jgi:subtilisin-like proprotein convertase family protein